MKTLKTLDVEALKEKMPEIEQTLHERDVTLMAEIGDRVDCVAMCGAYVFKQYKFTGIEYTSDSLQGQVDYYNNTTGSASGEGVYSGDFNMFMNRWFYGEPVYISPNYQHIRDTYVITVVKIPKDGQIIGHAVQLKAINPDGTVLVQDHQRACTDLYNLSQVAFSFRCTGGKPQ